MNKDALSEQALDERNKIVSCFNSLGWEPDESNRLFDRGEDVDFEAEFCTEHGDQLLSVQYDAEQQGLLFSIDGLSSSVTYLFDTQENIDELLSVFEAMSDGIKLENHKPFIRKSIEKGVKTFRFENGCFIEILLTEEKNDVIENIQKILENNGWVFVEGITDTCVETERKMADIGFCYFNNEFKAVVDLYIDTMQINHRLYVEDSRLFSNLNIYSSQCKKIVTLIDRWKNELRKNTYTSFVKDLIATAEKVIFDNNGTLLELDLHNL